jgi:hypothetical protein
MIYHNGWWHGSNSSFIRLLKDSVAIIVIGNKFTRAIYHAKVLTNIFGDYYNGTEEDESDAKLPDSLIVPNEAQFLQMPGTLSKDSMIHNILKEKKTDPVKKDKRKKPVVHHPKKK